MKSKRFQVWPRTSSVYDFWRHNLVTATVDYCCNLAQLHALDNAHLQTDAIIIQDPLHVDVYVFTIYSRDIEKNGCIV
jgi:hypothetical protein